MGLNCFGRRKRPKEPRQPPPSLDAIDRSAVALRQNDSPRNYRYVDPTQTARGSSPPPLPERHIEQSSPVANHRLSDNYQHSEMIPVSQHTDRSSTPAAARNGGALGLPTRQLSSELLSTPVPVGGKRVVPPSPEPVSHVSDSPVNSEDYLDPSTPIVASPREPISESSVSSGKQKASISDEKKNDIFMDYFQPGGPLNLSTNVPHRLSADKGPPSHLYTNMLDYPETFSPPPDGTARSNFDLHEHSGKSTSDVSASEHSVKSPRRPRPVPRTNTGSATSSRKQSLTSDCADDPSFTYENVQDTLRELANGPARDNNGSQSGTPRPQPRARVMTPDHMTGYTTGQVNNNHITNQTRSVVGGVKYSPLQERVTPADGYVHDAKEYVSSSSPPGSSSHPNRPLTTSTSDRLTALLPHGSVDLSAPIPKAAATEHGLAATYPRKGYLPMDQSPKTLAMLSNGTSQHRSSSASPSESCDLTIKVPVGNVNDLHVPGYITVLSESGKPSHIPKGDYYNLNEQPKPEYKGKYVKPSSPVEESPYFGG